MGHRSSKQLEEAPSEAIIFQTVLLSNLPIRYFIMKIFFALALVTCSVVLGVDGSCMAFSTDGVTCPCTATNTTGCSSLKKCSNANLKYKELCNADGWGFTNCANDKYGILKCLTKGSSTSSTTKKNVKIPKPGKACKSKITFPVKALKGVKGYPVMTEVFGIPIIAGSKFKKSNKLNHAASVMAELLDQDGDGCTDDPNVLRNLLMTVKDHGYQFRKAFVLPNKKPAKDAAKMAMKKIAMKNDKKIGFQMTLYVDFPQIKPKCSVTQTATCFDNSIEEIYHFITDYGYSKAYSKILGLTWQAQSNLTKAMDIARGKRMKVAPKN